MCVCSALVKLLNKSTEGTADDEDEGVTPDTAIRAGLELLKVLFVTSNAQVSSLNVMENRISSSFEIRV